MKKLAVFVEGYTEVVFVERLLEEIAGKENILIEHREIRGGANAPRSMGRVRATRVATGEKYFVLIVDCGNDRLVKTRIREEHQNLTQSGYTKIIGLRDVRPDFTHAEIPKLERNLPTYIRTSLIPVEFVLAILEVEAWFLAEVGHFLKIDPAITVSSIKSKLAFDPVNDDMEQRLKPADDLNACYGIGGKTYRKGDAKTTVNALDYAVVYLDLILKFRYLDRFIESIAQFLT